MKVTTTDEQSQVYLLSQRLILLRKPAETEDVTSNTTFLKAPDDQPVGIYLHG